MFNALFICMVSFKFYRIIFLQPKITSKQLFAYHQLECCVSSHGFFPCEWIRIVSSELLLFTWKSSIMSAYNWMKMNTFVEYESHFYRAKVTQLVSTQELPQSHTRKSRDFFLLFFSLLHCLVVCLPILLLYLNLVKWNWRNADWEYSVWMWMCSNNQETWPPRHNINQWEMDFLYSCVTELWWASLFYGYAFVFLLHIFKWRIEFK